jgi:triosephosphate isomerase
MNPLVIGNWKMNLDYVEAIHLTQQIGVSLRALGALSVEVSVAPPFLDFRSVSSVIEADKLAISLCAQHVNHRSNGAHTGEVSISMLRRFGTKYVLVGHSERRANYAMTDEVVAQTAARCAEESLIPVICIGEPQEVRSVGRQVEFLQQQISAALEGFPVTGEFVVAYEPVWAIGSGQAATPDVVCETVSLIQKHVEGLGFLDKTFLYGGSVAAENAESLLVDGVVNGFLVGGASLRSDAFLEIVSAVERCYGSSSKRKV